MAALNSQMQETLSVSGILLMKTFGREAQEATIFEDTASQVRDLSIRRIMIGRWFGMAMGLFGSVGPAVVYWYGGHQIIGGEASLGTVVALAGFLPRLFGPTAALMNVNVNVLSSLALFERIFDYLDLEPEISDRPDAIELTAVRGRIEFRQRELRLRLRPAGPARRFVRGADGPFRGARRADRRRQDDDSLIWCRASTTSMPARCASMARTYGT